ncbi:unnamed protein product, partial [Scytosiphon promiscuus]
MAHIVITGHGYTAVTAALQLKQLISDEDWITVISSERFGVAKSVLPYVGMGLRPINEVRVELKSLFRKFDLKYIFANIAELHPKRRVVVTETGQRVPFDYLVIADGMEPAWDHIPGLNRSHGMVHSTMDADEAMRTDLEFRDFLLSPGPLTVACAPGSNDLQSVYQYVLSVDYLLRRYRLRDKVPIRFVTAEPFLGHLGIGGIGESNRLFEGVFRSRQIHWICNAAIDRVDEKAFHIVYFDEDGVQRGRKEVETRFGVIWPAMRASSYLTKVEGLTDQSGLIKTNKFLQSTLYRNIFAIG